MNLIDGENYQFKVQARNTVGYSLDSEVITIRAARIPDAPVNLVNDLSVTTDERIKITWSDVPYDGGSPVIDYDIYFDQGLSVFVLLDSGIISKEYTTSVALTPGTTY